MRNPIPVSAVMLLAALLPLAAVNAQSAWPHPDLALLHDYNAKKQFNAQTVDTLRDATAPLLTMSLDDLRAAVRDDAARRTSRLDRSPYESQAQNLAQLFQFTKEDHAAQRAAVIMATLAADAQRLPPLESVDFHDWSKIVPAHVALAYDLVHDAPGWDDASRTAVEAWLRDSAWSLARLGLTERLTNITPFGLRHAFGAAVAVGDADLLRALVRVVDRLYSPEYFHADGMWYEGALSYHQQTVGNTELALLLLKNAWSDPPDYTDRLLGLRLDHTDLRETGRWPLRDKALAVMQTTRYPDGRYVPIGDTHCGPAQTVDPANLHNIELWHYGFFALTHAPDATQLGLQFSAQTYGTPFSGGHRHGDRLAMTLFAAGDDLLPDAGYAFQPKNHRYYHMDVVAHNVPWVWSPSHDYRQLAGLWTRPALLAYHAGDDVQLVEAAAPGPARMHVDLRRRLLMLIATNDGGSYAFDLSRLKGGAAHQWFLRQTENEDARLDAACALSPATIAGPGIADYRDLMRDPQAAPGSQPLQFTWTGVDSSAAVRVFLNAVKNDQVYFSRVPRLRPTKQDPALRDDFPGWHFQRRRIVPELVDIDLTFSEDEASVRDRFELNASAARSGAFSIQRAKTSNIADYLVLLDNDASGAPEACLPLGQAAVGELIVDVATEAQQNQQAAIDLMSGDAVVARVQLRNNTDGAIVIGSDAQPFSGVTSMWRTARTLRFTWRDDRITIALDGVASVESALSAAPNCVRFAVGYGSGVDRGLIVDRLQFRPVKPLTSYAAVYDAWRRDESATVRDVQWLDVAPADEGAMAARVTLASGESDVVYAALDAQARSAGGHSFAAPYAVARFDADGALTQRFTLGAGGPVMQGALLDVLGRRLLVDAPPPTDAASVIGQWLTITFGDGSARGLRVTGIEPVGAARSLVEVHDDPAIAMTDDGVRQLSFPHQASHTSAGHGPTVISGPAVVTLAAARRSH